MGLLRELIATINMHRISPVMFKVRYSMRQSFTTKREKIR